MEEEEAKGLELKATNCVQREEKKPGWMKLTRGGECDKKKRSRVLLLRVFQGVQQCLCQWVLAEAMEQKQKPGLLPTRVCCCWTH